MAKYVVPVIILTFLTGCSSPNIFKTRSISNPNMPYVYINGFKDYKIVPILTLEGRDSLYINELRFNATNSAMYTEKFMYDHFGKWNKELWTDNKLQPVLLWEKIKLFPTSEETFDVVAGGVESYENCFASVMVYDSKNNDCLADKAVLKNTMIQYFSDGIRKLKNKKKFYDVYWEMFNAHSKK